MNDPDDLLVLEPDEVAFWQAVYVALLPVYAADEYTPPDDESPMTADARDAAFAADEAVRLLRARRTATLGGGPEHVGTDPPKDGP